MKLKTHLLLTYLLVICCITQAQSGLHVSTSNKEFCYWNPSTKLFDKCGDNPEFLSMFVFNSDQTVIVHTTNDIKSSYFVSSKDYMSGCSCYAYTVTSDVGNKYTFIADFEKGLFKILSSGHTEETDDYLIMFTIKSHWYD